VCRKSITDLPDIWWYPADSKSQAQTTDIDVQKKYHGSTGHPVVSSRYQEPGTDYRHRRVEKVLRIYRIPGGIQFRPDIQRLFAIQFEFTAVKKRSNETTDFTYLFVGLLISPITPLLHSGFEPGHQKLKQEPRGSTDAAVWCRTTPVKMAENWDL